MRFTLEATGATLVGEDLGSGPPVVLLHAGAERRTVWDPIVEVLVAAGYRCVTLDQRGHGESSGSRASSFEAFVDDIARLRDRVGQPAVFVGASLGGLAALRVIASATARDPASSAGLVLVDVVPDPDHELVRTGLTRTAGEAVARAPLVHDILSRAEELRAAARALALPVLLVRAERSFGLLDADAERFRALVPHAQHALVRDSGHLIAREQPHALAGLLAAFMARPDVAGRMRPPSDTPRGRAEAWLRARGAGAIPHLAGTLLEHLRRTALRLARWDAPEHVELAGLCHAAYGTDGFDTSLTHDRNELREAVGADAERIVHLYGACDREHLYAQLGQPALHLRDRSSGEVDALSQGELDALVLLTLANELDVALHASDDGLARAIRGLIERLAPHRPREAALALAQLDEVG